MSDLLAQVQQLREALERLLAGDFGFVGHVNACRSQLGEDCSCGFSALAAGEPSQDRDAGSGASPECVSDSASRADHSASAIPAAVREPAARGCYCGYLGWTVEKYGRVTHKEGCPARTDPWHQGDPYPRDPAAGEPE